MDPYEDSMRLQEMIDSDMQSSMEFVLNNDNSLEGPTLTDLAPAVPVTPLESYDNQLDIEMTSASEVPWLSCSWQFALGPDFEGPGSLLVNPQTALPNSLPEPETPVAVITTSLIETPSQTCTSSGDNFSSDDNKDDCSIIVDESLSAACDEATLMAEDQPQASPEDASSVEIKETIEDSMITNAISINPSEALPNAILCAPISILENATAVNEDSNKEQVTVQINENHTKTNVAKPKHKVKPLVSQENKGHTYTNQSTDTNPYPKPAFSYSCLIAMALKNSKTGSLPVNEIYNFMTENFPYFKTAPNGWKNSVRHNLSLNKCFEKVDKPPDTNGNQRKGCLWAMNPEKIEKMDEEVLKWSRKDPLAIQRSMANPDKFALLEKGHMKENKILDEVTDNASNEMAVTKSEDEDHLKENQVIMTEEKSATDVIGLDTGLSLDSSLGELELQKGLGVWEDFDDDDRLHLFSENISSSSSSPHSASIIVTNSLGCTVPETPESDAGHQEEAGSKQLELCITNRERDSCIDADVEMDQSDASKRNFDEKDIFILSPSTPS